MQELQKSPLVSVTVLTYNSSKYVLETLESIKAQIYKNIELIVSDDCSTDNTVEICRNWIEENKERFMEVHLVISPINTGIPANKNRAIAKCRGEWVKGIAGDDLLYGNCISSYIDYINSENKVISFIYARQILFFNNSMEIIPREARVPFGEYSSEKQYNILLRTNSLVPAPTTFIKMNTLKSIGLLDESIFIEDWPLYLKLAKNKIKLHYLNKITVKYRVHDKSFYNGRKSDLKKSNDYDIGEFAFYKKYIKNNISTFERLINYMYFKYRYHIFKILKEYQTKIAVYYISKIK